MLNTCNNPEDQNKLTHAPPLLISKLVRSMLVIILTAKANRSRVTAFQGGKSRKL